MQSNENVLTGKEQAKLNKQKTFFNKLERQITQLNGEKESEFYFPIKYQKQSIFPEYDDLALLLDGSTEIVKDIDRETVSSSEIALPDLNEGYFLKNMSKNGKIKLFKEETFENSNGTIRKGSTGSIDDYNYQKAYNFYVQVVDKEELLKVIEKEKEEPTTYKIPVKTKKIEKKKYIKTYRYPRRHRR